MALNKKNTYTDYKIQSKPRFKSGVAVIDNAVEKGAQSRNTKRQNKAASPDAQKEALKARQRKLADAGYYKGKIDGIWGKQSKAAQAAYDKANGKKGEIKSKGQINTQQANLGSAFMSLFQNLGLSEDQAQTAILKLPKKPIDRYGNLTDQCAAYVNKVLMDNGKFSKGNAPQVNRQFKTIYNGYSNIDRPDMSNYSHADSVKTILEMHHQAADNFAQQMDTTKLDRNHMYPVNMYYGRTPRRGDASPHTTDFYEMGVNNDTPGSHVGLVYSDPEKGWRVSHNIHGKIHDEPLTSVLGSNGRYGIIGMSDAGEIKDKPQYKEVKWYDPRSWFKNGGLLSKKFKSGGYFYNGKVIKGQSGLTIVQNPDKVPSSQMDAGARQIMAELMDQYDYYTRQGGISPEEYEAVAKAIMGVGGTESKYGDSIKYKAKQFVPNVAFDLYHVGKGQTALTSRGVFQEKVGQDYIGESPETQTRYRNKYGRYGMNSLLQVPQQVASSPRRATQSALIKMVDNVKKLRNMDLTNKFGKQIPLSDALMFSWHFDVPSNWRKANVLNDNYTTTARDYSNNFEYLR